MSQDLPKLIAAPDIIPPATEAMQHPEFWINRIGGNPDRKIMTPEQIRTFNSKNRTRSSGHKDVHGNTVTVDSEVTRGNFMGITYHIEDPLLLHTYPVEKLRERLQRIIDHIRNGNFWDRRRIPYPEGKKQELIAAIDIGSLSGEVTPRYGITVRNTLNRVAPTADRVFGSQYQWLDMFQNSVFETGTPVAVLHASKDGEWLCVKSDISIGWVPASNVALGDADFIRDLADPDDFVVAITHKVPIYADKECTIWLTDLYMGAKLGLKDKVAAAYRVNVPFRGHDGAVMAVNGWIKAGAEVSAGYQPYTQRNVITTFFRLLNRPYGWGGMDHERACTGTIRAVFRTFGIFMPPWTTFQLAYTDHVITFPKDTSKEEKYRYLDTCEPGITVCGFDWHVTLYLGKVDGFHYVIHQNGYSYHDENGNEVRVGRVSVNTTELEGGADIGQWTDLAVFKP